MKFVRKNITIREDQDRFLDSPAGKELKLSGLVQAILDKRMAGVNHE